MSDHTEPKSNSAKRPLLVACELHRAIRLRAAKRAKTGQDITDEILRNALGDELAELEVTATEAGR